MTTRCRVTISGRTLSGAPLQDLRGEVGRAFALQDEQLDRMLSGRPAVVSRNATPDAAEKLVARLRALDLEATVEPLPPVEAEPSVPPGPGAAEPAAAAGADRSSAELFALSRPAPELAELRPQGLALQPDEAEVHCPKCGEGQPRRTLCRSCGLDMPRFAAAQEAAEREAREERAAQLSARTTGGARTARRADAPGASVLGIGLSGRLGRLDYLAASLVSTLIGILFVLLTAKTGKASFAGFGMFLSTIYGLRCLALRLHDTGRTGWLSLIVFVPVLGGLMALALLFLRGDDDDNDYGEMPADGGGRRALAALAALLVLGTFSFRNIAGDPETLAAVLAAMSATEGAGAAGEEGDDTDELTAARYAHGNRIDVYVIAGCTDCEDMREWLDGKGLRYTTYAVDSDQGAAERLQSILPNGQGRIQLPVLEVNGQVLPGNPGVEAVHRRLRQE